MYYSKLTPQKRREVRIQLVEAQKGLCYWCKHSLDASPPAHILNKSINWSLFPPNFLKHPIHLQHDHKTDLVEGAVHAKCNAVMWQYYGR